MIEVSSVAQYERNCHINPMLERLVVKPGLAGTIGTFVLTASKHKSYLNWMLTVLLLIMNCMKFVQN